MADAHYLLLSSPIAADTMGKSNTDDSLGTPLPLQHRQNVALLVSHDDSSARWEVRQFTGCFCSGPRAGLVFGNAIAVLMRR